MEKLLNISFPRMCTFFLGLMIGAVGAINRFNPEEVAKPEKHKLFFTWTSTTLLIIGVILIAYAMLKKEKTSENTKASD